MKKAVILLKICLVISLTFSISKAELSRNSIILTLRQQNTIKLDYALAKNIDSMLKTAVQIDTALKSTFAQERYVWNDLILLHVDSSSWAKKLLAGEFATGDRFIDSLSQVFKLSKVEDMDAGWMLLEFDDTLKIELLMQTYLKRPDIILAQPNWVGYLEPPTPPDIVYIPFCKDNKFVFKSRSFINSYLQKLWYIIIDTTNQYSAKLMESDTLTYDSPKLYLWNYPERFDVTIFKSVDEIKDSITKSANWWVRRYAIEASYRLFAFDDSWVGEDNWQIFNKLKSDIELRWMEFITLFQNYSISDDCIYVQKSAKVAFDSIKMPDIVSCDSTSVMDSLGIMSVKLFWSHQYNGVTNYFLKVYGNSYDFSDSTLTDTTYKLTGFTAGNYWWDVRAKNEYGWSDYSPGYGCYFNFKPSDVTDNRPNKNFNISLNPNIINNDASLNFSLHQYTNVKIYIMDLLGYEEMILVDKYYLPGEHKEIFNFTAIPDGYYFLKASIDGYVYTKPLIVIH